jgi:hypothetical protein
MGVPAAGAPGQPLPEALPVGRDYPAPVHLAGASIEMVEGQLAGHCCVGRSQWTGDWLGDVVGEVLSVPGFRFPREVIAVAVR